MTKSLAIPRSQLKSRYLLHDRIFGRPITLLGRVINMRPVPNILTCLRAGMAFIFYYYLYELLFQFSVHNLMMVALWIFLIGLSDAIDGYIAHKFEGCSSEWGAKYDPLADKLVVFGAYTIFGIWFLATNPVAQLDDKGAALYLATLFCYTVMTLHRGVQDVESTVLYFRHGGNSIFAGKVKFALDLLAISIGIACSVVVHHRGSGREATMILMISCQALAAIYANWSLTVKRATIAGQGLAQTDAVELPPIIMAPWSPDSTL